MCTDLTIQLGELPVRFICTHTQVKIHSIFFLLEDYLCPHLREPVFSPLPVDWFAILEQHVERLWQGGASYRFWSHTHSLTYKENHHAEPRPNSRPCSVSSIRAAVSFLLCHCWYNS
jgi:hypothetical protein